MSSDLLFGLLLGVTITLAAVSALALAVASAPEAEPDDEALGRAVEAAGARRAYHWTPSDN